MTRNCSNCRDWYDGFCKSGGGINAAFAAICYFKSNAKSETDVEFQETDPNFYCSDWEQSPNWEKSPEEQKAAQAWEKRMKERKERRSRKRGKFTFTNYGLNLNYPEPDLTG